MTTGNKTLAVDVLEVLRSQLSWIGPCRPDGDEIDCERWDRIEAAIAAAADLIDAARAMSAVLHKNGQYDDGCFYYFGLSSPELERPLSVIDSAIARVKGESA
ncbi:TPA: hypothetical protein ACOECL_000477 [Stenotrophomonas maltophilia]